MLISPMTTVQEMTDKVSRYKRFAPATLKGWKYAIRGFESMPVDKIDLDFVDDRRCALLYKDYKESYVRTQLGYCGTIWKWGMKRRLVESNPWRGSLEGLEAGKKDYPYLPLEHYSACGLTSHPVFMALWYHGFRVSEITGITPDEMKVDADIPHFSIIDTTIRRVKNKPSRRIVPMHPLYLAGNFHLKHPFSDNPKSGDNFSRYMKHRCGHSAHGIRHNIATRMRKAGIEYSIAASILGHKPIGMTAHYGHILLEDKLEQLQKLR